MNKKIILYISIAIAVIVLIVIGIFFSKNEKKEETVTIEEITIIEYSPQSGPSGSLVSLKLDSVPGNLIATYNGQEIAIDGIAEDIVKIIIPYNALSGDIQVKVGDAISNSVHFTVEEMELIELASETVSFSSEKQTISYNDEINVTIPPGLVKENKKLTISEIKNAPSTFISDQITERHSFDVSIEGMGQLDNYIEIGVKYDASLLDPDKPAENQFIAMRWNEDEGYWLTLPTRVDTQNQMLYMLTDHLTGFEWVIIGGAVIATKPLTLAGEAALNDVYITPQGNFKILYSKSTIDEDAALNDDWWVRKTYSDAGQIDYDNNHPKSIQDVGNLFETALAKYLALGFENPVKVKGEWFGDGTYKKPIFVKIDSWWLAVSGEPNYEKIWQRIHIPSVRLKDKDFMKMTIGHELFHRMQAEYYGRAGFSNPWNSWWLESTAEYAGHNVAWDYKIVGLNGQIGADFLSHSIATKGLVQGQGWGEKRYEYASAVFIKYLVENKGLNFYEMFNFIQEGIGPLGRLETFVRNQGGDLLGYYRDFSIWSIFSPDSYLSQYNIADLVDQEDTISLIEDNAQLKIETGPVDSQDVFVSLYNEESNLEANLSGESSHSLSANSGDIIYLLAVNGDSSDKSISVTVKNEKENAEVTYTFNLEGDYSSKLWTIKVGGKIKVTGRFIVGIGDSREYGQEVYTIDNTEHKIVVEGGKGTLYISSDCELWYFEEHGEICVYKITGTASGSFTVWHRNKYYYSDGSVHWSEWETNPDYDHEDFTGVFNPNDSSYYIPKMKDFRLIIRPVEGEMNTINALIGSYDFSTKRFIATAHAGAVAGLDGSVNLRWISDPIDIDLKKE